MNTKQKINGLTDFLFGLTGKPKTGFNPSRAPEPLLILIPSKLASKRGVQVYMR